MGYPMLFYRFKEAYSACGTILKLFIFKRAKTMHYV